MKPHQQLCGLALALNLVADHWTLLVVRELLPGPRRFSDLRASLAPVASNLLSSRLKEMSAQGLVEAVVLTEASVAAYALTPRGRELREVVDALVRWSIPEFLRHLGLGYREDPRWLLVAVPALAGGVSWEGPPLRVRIEVANLGFVLVLEPGRRPEARREEGGEVVVKGPYAAVLGLFAGVVVPGHGAGAVLQVAGEGPGWAAFQRRWGGAEANRG